MSKTKIILTTNWILATCSITDEEVVGEVGNKHMVLDVNAVWWYCPDCQGWHIVSTADSELGQSIIDPSK